MSTAREFAWLNGEIAPREAAAPSVASNNLHLGTGVFDGIMAYWNDGSYLLHAVLPHLHRFCAGVVKMRLPIGFGASEIHSGIVDLLRHLPEDNHYIRPLALRRGPELYDVSALDAPADVVVIAVSAERDVDRALRCCLSPWRRVSSSAIPVRWKVSGAYANSMIAQYDAYERGYDTAIMLDARGRISESCTSNIFFISQGKLITPSLDADVFPGITRSIVASLAAKRGIRVIERDIYPDDILSFSGAFIGATLLEVRKLASIDDHVFSDAEDDVFHDILVDFRDITHGVTSLDASIDAREI